MMAPEADEVVPMFSPLLVGEPVPVNGEAEGARYTRLDLTP
jgi:hypothetical protein